MRRAWAARNKFTSHARSFLPFKFPKIKWCPFIRTSQATAPRQCGSGRVLVYVIYRPWERVGLPPPRNRRRRGTRAMNQEDNRSTKKLDATAVASAAVVAHCGGGGGGRTDSASFQPRRLGPSFLHVRVRAPRPSDRAYLSPSSPPPPLPQVVLLSSASRGSAGHKAPRIPVEISTRHTSSILSRENIRLRVKPWTAAATRPPGANGGHSLHHSKDTLPKVHLTTLSALPLQQLHNT